MQPGSGAGDRSNEGAREAAAGVRVCIECRAQRSESVECREQNTTIGSNEWDGGRGKRNAQSSAVCVRDEKRGRHALKRGAVESSGTLEVSGYCTKKCFESSDG